MEGRLDRMEKNINDLLAIVVSTKDYMTTKLVTREELDIRLFQAEERIHGKIEGAQRSVDGLYGLHSTLEARVTKLETTRYCPK